MENSVPLKGHLWPNKTVMHRALQSRGQAGQARRSSSLAHATCMHACEYNGDSRNGDADDDDDDDGDDVDEITD